MVVMLGVHLKRSGWMNMVTADTKSQVHHNNKIPEHIPHTSNTLQERILPVPSKVTYSNLQSNLSSDESELYGRGTKHGSDTYISGRDPNVILIGIAKTGTGTLLNYLKHHPSIQRTPYLGEKAMHCYFNSSKYQEDNMWYRSQLPALNPALVILDKCLYYLDPIYDKKIPERIYKFNKSIKFLIMTREPVSRVQSAYTQRVVKANEKGNTASTLEDIVYKKGTKVIDESSTSIRLSCYSKAWLKWLDVFPREQFHIIDGGTFTKDPYLELHKLETFLNITSYFKREMFSFNKEKGFYCRVDSKGEADCMASGKGRKHIPMSEDLHKRLSDYFENCNQLLPKLGGKRFSWIS